MNFMRSILPIAAVAVAILGWLWLDSGAQVDANCSAAYHVDEVLPNGGRWELCWEHRSLDGIVLRDIFYTTPNGSRRKILSEASLSQVHVPYDDNTARFHDITDDGFGDGNLSNLVPDECPEGTLLQHGSKNAVCKQIIRRGFAFRADNQSRQGYTLKLFSISTSGEYNYIPEWHFWDDGTIQPIIGAAGKLQRFGTNPQFGWPLRQNNVVGVSHIHNYYYRLDFDIGDIGTDDVVEELDIVPDPSGNGRTFTLGVLENEAGRSVEPGRMRTWRIRDGNSVNADGHPITYQLNPLQVSHRDIGPAFEPWTEHDLYVTKYNVCERYASHNPRFDGCGYNITEFVNNESLVGQDSVLWYGVTFHHVPRDEDEPYMHTHWDGFQIAPMDWTADNELVINLSPNADFVVEPSAGNAPLNVTVDATSSSDPDGEIVSYAWNFGDGSEASEVQAQHIYETPGNYTIVLTVTDNDGESSQTSRIVSVGIRCQIGDVNCDERVNVVDALFILQSVRGSRTPSDQFPLPEHSLYGPACDVNADGACTQEDSTAIFECSTGIANDYCPSAQIVVGQEISGSVDVPATIYIPFVD